MQQNRNYLIEIATTDFNTTRAAVAGGAGRIELCAALTEGGITPSFGLIKQCRMAFALPLFPIIRPRSGDFLYNDEEFELMKQDVRLCKALGCDGIVTGLLQRNGAIDLQRTERLATLAYPLEITFHRAFDRCRDPFEALEQLIDIGCQRILTSGQQAAAPEGADLIAALVHAAGQRIVIMPGSGVRKDNIRMLADKTGAREFHSSLRSREKSRMDFIHPAFAAGEESYTQPAIQPAEVRALQQALNP